MQILGYLFAFLFVSVLSATLNGWAFAVLWLWFVVPIFDVPQLTIPTSIGLMLVVAYLTRWWDTVEAPPEDEFSELLFKAVVISVSKPLFALVFGAIVKCWL